MADGEPPKPLLPFEEGANDLISESEQIFYSQISYSNVVQVQVNKGQCHETYYHQLDSEYEIADKKALLGNLKHILVGKFSHSIKTFFASLKLQGMPMRIFKWESDFTPIKESSLAPVWI
ncbi:hypothetical protein LIER_18265 [Lithospermum erythrorhizon]|uniref:Uncharacterized protein n=1 Tax=Lithospermum erythrorhizon TaxID=34254 RepID=A0AAV3QHT5_LITER